MSRPSAYLQRSALAGIGLVFLGLLAAPATAQRAKPSGAEVWGANCSRCHRMRAVDAYNASQWDAIVTAMALNARLTPDETEAVREFLVGSAKAREATSPASGSVAPAGGARQIAYLSAAVRLPAILPKVAPACGPTPGGGIFKAQCEVCHGSKGKGDGPAAAGFSPRPPNLSDAARMAKLSDDSLGKVVSRGRNAMPGFGSTLKPEEIREVLAHVRCLSNTQLPPARGSSGSGSSRLASR